MMTKETSPQEAQMIDALSKVIDPDIRRPITDLGMVSDFKIDENGVAYATLHLTIATCHAAHMLEQQSIEALQSLPGVNKVDLTVQVMTPTERANFIEKVRGKSATRKPAFGKDSLTRVIAVTSGKGGVGKSSVTANLAVQLAKDGSRVGIIDADIFGFSIPALMGLSKGGRVDPPIKIDDMIIAPEAHGVKVISIGMFLGEADGRNTAVSWRGPMLHRTIEQFLRDVYFGDLDILLLDLPPGTGDVALSVGQLLPQAEVLVITTPQPSASDVAVRSGILSLTSGQQILGVIENMGAMVLPDGSSLNMFGDGGGSEVADRLTKHKNNTSGKNVQMLGTIPLSVELRTASDEGEPAVLRSEHDAASVAIAQIAAKISASKKPLAGRLLQIDPT